MTAGNCIPIFTYHSLDDGGSVISTSPAIFGQQMDFLRVNGYQTLSLSEVTHIVRQREQFPKKTCVITFDDGYQNVYSKAFPVLQQYGFRATIFLIAEFCGRYNNWPTHASPVGLQPLLSWTEIKEMDRYGIEFGSHTLTHPDLTRIVPKEAEREIVRSKEMIQSHLGKKVDVFAYPYGKYSSEVVALARQHFAGACSTRLGKVTRDSNPFLLNRLDMYYLSLSLLQRTLQSHRLDWYWSARQVLRDLRNA